MFPQSKALTSEETSNLDSPMQNIPGLSQAVGESAVTASNVSFTFENRYFLIVWMCVVTL